MSVKTIKHKPCTNGFSLLELLVAIAVVATLCIVGMGAVKSLREKTMNSRCLSNLRSISIGLAGYIGEYGYYPGAQPDYPAQRYWYHIFEPYITGEPVPELDAPPSPWAQCPAKTSPPEHRGFSYGYNYFGFGNFPESYGQWDTIPRLGKYWHVRPAAVEEPANAIVIGDNRESGGYPRFLYNNTANRDAYATRHFDGGNYLFADGHIEWLSADAMARRAPDKKNVYPFQ